MFKVGITGGIGSGKTTICKLFELQGIPVFYADTEAKMAMNTDNLLIQKLKSRFGDDIYSADGLLNRSRLATLVFNHADKLVELNEIVHPAVFRLFDNWVAQQKSSYVIKEAALLFESNSYKDCDSTILVKSPQALKIARVVKRDSITEADVLKRMEKQLSDEEKEKLSEFIVLNDEQQLIIPQVLRLHDTFLERAQST
ncbi:MAG: dephospho-CoA kinase [Pyrinomonadaceae bacterium]|nr:dephospho-CoA kinase [Sphingobacteriaceae bacterium]